MVVKSEYRSSFKSKFDCFVKTYEGNVGYRMQRRLVEAGHSQDAFIWDESDWESDSENSCNEKPKNNRRPASVPPHLYKHRKFTEAYQKRLESQRNIVIQQGVCQQTKDQRSKDDDDDDDYINVPNNIASPRDVQQSDDQELGHRDRQVQTPDWSRVKKKKKRTRKTEKKTSDPDHREQASQTNGIEAQTQVDHSAEDAPAPTAAAATAEKPMRPKKPAQKIPRYRTPLPKPRPMSAPLGRPAKKSPRAAEEERPPFLPYGFKDKERETGTKKTHNVRASVDVYPSAMRAQRRKKSDIEKREKDAKSASLRERRQKALFNAFDEKMRKDTSQWETEYRSHFAGYDRGLYERAKCCKTPSTHDQLAGSKMQEYFRSSW